MKFFKKIIVTAILCAVTALSAQASEAPTSPTSPTTPKPTRPATPIKNFSTEWATELLSLEKLVDNWTEKTTTNKGSLVKEIIEKNAQAGSNSSLSGWKNFKDYAGLVGIGVFTLPATLENPNVDCDFLIKDEAIKGLSNLHAYLESSIKAGVQTIKPSIIHGNKWLIKTENKKLELVTLREIPLSDNQRIACNFAQKNNQKAQDFMEKNPEDFPPKKQGTKRKR